MKQETKQKSKTRIHLDKDLPLQFRIDQHMMAIQTQIH